MSYAGLVVVDPEGGYLKKWTFDFKGSSRWDGTWSNGEIKTIEGIQIKAYFGAGQTSHVIDGDGWHPVGGTAAGTLEIVDVSEIDPDIDFRVGTYALLMETDADDPAPTWGLMYGDAVNAVHAGYPNFGGVSRITDQIKAFGGYGSFQSDIFQAQAGTSVRALAMLMNRGNYKVYYSNVGGAGPGQLFPTSLDIEGYNNGSTGNNHYTVDNAGKIAMFVSPVMNCTRLTIWKLAPPDGGEVEQL